MTIELNVPRGWTAGQALAMRALLQKALDSGQPVVALLRADATPDQVAAIYRRVAELIDEAGLAA